jgi:hypothetical protein
VSCCWRGADQLQIAAVFVFIGECKRWSGSKAVKQALAQLFSYTTWRDARLALLFFVGTRDPSSTLAAVREELEASEQFIE